MADEKKRSISELLSDNELLNNALSRAARDAILSHARAGRPVPICPNGEIVWLTPEQVFAMYPEAKPAQTKAS